MPRLILDEQAMQLAMQKLRGQAIYDGPDGEFLKPGLVDLVDEGDDSGGRWQPGDKRTKLLTLGAEACRDVTFHAERVFSDAAQRRAIRAVIVPTCNLMDTTIQLVAEFNDTESRKMREAWPENDQVTYREAARRLKKKHSTGPVRVARNKMLAHLDPDVYEKPADVDLDDILGALRDSLVVLLLAMNHKSHSFAWIRRVGTTAD